MYKPIPHNCLNCNAVLTSNKCEYCGAVYDVAHGYKANSVADDFPIGAFVREPVMLEVTTLGDTHITRIIGR